jgi:hypothetical protein
VLGDAGRGAVALMNLMIGGQAIAYLSAGLLTALTPVAIVSGSVPVAGAGLMAIMCFGVGLSAAPGLHRGMLLIPMHLAFMIIAPPPWSGQTVVDRTSNSYLLRNMLFLGCAGFDLRCPAPLILAARPTVDLAERRRRTRQGRRMAGNSVRSCSASK